MCYVILGLHATPFHNCVQHHLRSACNTNIGVRQHLRVYENLFSKCCFHFLLFCTHNCGQVHVPCEQIYLGGFVNFVKIKFLTQLVLCVNIYLSVNLDISSKLDIPITIYIAGKIDILFIIDILVNIYILIKIYIFVKIYILVKVYIFSIFIFWTKLLFFNYLYYGQN